MNTKKKSPAGPSGSSSKQVRKPSRPRPKKHRTDRAKISTAPKGMIRLQKVLAEAGVAARRKCEELILSGGVEVNGRLVEGLPAFVDPDRDIITVGRKRIRMPERVYYLLHKPKNVICSNSDPQGRRLAIELVDTPHRIFCVGRLDVDTTGAIILTNDAELANRLTHPRYELPKTYELRIRGRVDGEAIEKLKTGVWLAEGRASAAMVKVVRRNNLETVLEIVIRQSINRQISRMLARVGYKVMSLRRTKIGNITLKDIPIGCCRPMSKSQVDYLKRMTGMDRDDKIK
jgi:23S rRNA pseudouridine2605 synthase